MNSQQISAQQTPDTTPDASPAPVVSKIGLLPTPYWDRYVGLGMLPFVINGTRVNLYTSLARADMRKSHLLLPLPRQLPMIWLEGDVSIGDLARALGLGTHDYALPQQWVKRNYWDRGLPMPMGVWDYTHNRVMGQFLGFAQSSAI